jgi:ATP-dependent Clp protease ATP-binding subunit ClpC
MFERFTDRARHVLVLAQEDARMLGHNYVGTEHILLGLIRESEGIAAQALTQLDISMEDVQTYIKATQGETTGRRMTGAPPFSPRVKKVLELSFREALTLGHNYIDTEHILLGLVREGEGTGVLAITSTGTDLGEVRHMVIKILSSYAPITPDPDTGAHAVLEAAMLNPIIKEWREARAAVQAAKEREQRAKQAMEDAIFKPLRGE